MSFAKVTGKCYIAYEDCIESTPLEWLELGPHRFFFREAYDPNRCVFSEVPNVAKKVGIPGKGKGE